MAYSVSVLLDDDEGAVQVHVELDLSEEPVVCVADPLQPLVSCTPDPVPDTEPTSVAPVKAELDGVTEPSRTAVRKPRCVDDPEIVSVYDDPGDHVEPPDDVNVYPFEEP